MSNPKVGILDENLNPFSESNPLAVDIEFDANSNPIRSNLEGGGMVSVGTTPVEMTFTGVPFHILLTADINNTGTLYVGKSNVTSTGANAVTFLQPGDALSMAYDDSSNAVYVVASAASQNVWKGALL